MTHAIKFRRKGDRVWYFATSRGNANRLRIHAALFSKEQAEKAVIADQKNNPNLEFKVVSMV